MIELWHEWNSVHSYRVRIVLAEKRLAWVDHTIELLAFDNLKPEYLRINPDGVVPTLVHDGAPIYDSSVICEYLDSKHRGDKLFPASGARRWKALRLQAIGDGILDAALLARYETAMRPEKLRWTDWLDGQKRKLAQALDQLEKEAKDLAGGLTIGQVTVACALGYLDFRFGDMNWRKGRPKLAAWYDKFSRRKSMQATIPA